MEKIKLLSLVFIMILSLFSIAPTTEASTQFKDVSNNHWAKSDIDYLVSKGVIKGYSDGTFRPESPVTKRQVALMLVRALGIDTKNKNIPDPQLNDVNSSTDGYKEIAVAIDEGFFEKSSYFNPNEPITRLIMAKALARAYNIIGEYQGVISDVKGEGVYEYVSALAFNGITNIYPDGTFKPSNQVTRAQFSAFMTRTMKLREKTGTLKGNVTWQYNQFIGTKADTGAKVFVIPTGFNPTLYGYKKHDLELYSMIGSAPKHLNLHYAKVDGMGTYEISNIPIGEYIVIISSKNTTRDFSKPVESYLVDVYKPLFGEAYPIFEQFNLNLEKSTFEIIEINENQTTNSSHDFGYTYL